VTLEDLSLGIIICHPFPEIKGGEERFLKYFSEFLQNRNIRFKIVSSISRTNAPNIVGIGINPFKLPLVGFTPYLLLFSLIAGIRIILMNKHQSFSLIHSMDIGYSGLAGLFASKILGIKFIAHSHCCRASALRQIVLLRDGITKYFLNPFSHFESSIDKLISRNADHIIAVSPEIKQYVNNLGVPFSKISVIPMGIETSHFTPQIQDKEEVRQEFGIPEKSFVVGYIGRIGTPDKRLQTLIEAFSIFKRQTCPNSFLLVVGDGNRTKYENQIKEIGVESVVFTGFRQDVERMLAALDVFVLPSLSEGCPFSLLEAMAAKKTIAASDILGIREIVENEKEALLFDPKDVNALEKILIRLYNESDLRLELAEKARIKVRQFERNIVLTQILELYTKIN